MGGVATSPAPAHTAQEAPAIRTYLLDESLLDVDPRVNAPMKVLCAFAITFIVAGHAGVAGQQGGINLAYNLFPPQSFHVGVFLFVAGYFYKAKQEARPWHYVKGRLLRLIVPLYVLNTLWGVWTQVAHGIGFTFGKELSAYNLLVDPLLGGHAFMWDCPLWFVAPLFFTEMIDFALRKLFKVGDDRRNEIVLIVVYFVVGFATTALCGPAGFAEESSGLLVLLGRIGYFLPCYAFGRLYRLFLEKHDTAPNWAYFGVVCAVQLVVMLVSAGTYTYIVSWCQFYSGVVAPYITTAAGIAFWLRISRLLAPALAQSPSLRAVADGTYSIMANQFAGFFLMKSFFLLLFYLGLAQGFDTTAFFSDIFYYWTPPVLGDHAGAASAFALVYVVAGILVPLGMHKVWRIVRDDVCDAVRRRQANRGA